MALERCGPPRPWKSGTRLPFYSIPRTGSEDVVRHRRRHAAHDVRHGDDHAEVQQIDADGLRDRDEQRQQHGDRGNALQEEAEDQQDHGDDEQDRIVAQTPPRLARPTAFGEV